jgi:hypothetical protein
VHGPPSLACLIEPPIESGSAECAPYACTTAGIHRPHFQIPQHLLSMSSYWSSFPDFDHNPNTPVSDEFQRLAKLKGWMGKDGNKTEKYRQEWAKCFQAEFEKYYGKDTSSLAGWQTLCREFRLDVIPESVKKCKSVSHFPYRLPAVMLFVLKIWGRP